MRCIIGDLWYPTIDAGSLQISRAATDPVPTCTLDLIDNTSSLTPQSPQEILILDDKQTPNPTINRLFNPAINPYTTSWVSTAFTGISYATAGGGGLQVTMSNAAVTFYSTLYQVTQLGGIKPGQAYTFSAFVQGSSSPTGFFAYLALNWIDAANNLISQVVFNGPTPPSTSLTRYVATGTAPSNAVFAQVIFGIQVTNATNSGVVTFTQAQLEPNWLAPNLTYPTPWCGPNQTNAQQLPLGFWIRQSRKFAGFVTKVWPQKYHGNVRTQTIDAAGYAWLLGMVYCNDSFSGQTDAQILIALANKYLCNGGTLSSGANLCSTTNVQTGQTTTTITSNWDDPRALYDGMAGISTFYWTIDYYWNLIYAPLGYFSQGITLICDNSSQPDLKTTFPGYDFTAESDFTQPGSTVLCLGSGSNVSLVSDPAQIQNLAQLSGYFLPVANSWMRKVNDSNLGSTADATNRALAELLIFDYPRNLYHVKTQVELIPGQSIQVTSATDNLNLSTQLVQQTTGVWKGTDSTLTDVWEYTSDLGATNRHATSMISRIFRQTQKGTSAPAIASTTLVVFDNLSVVESVGTGTTVSNYLQTVVGDAPLVLCPLGEITGTIADDISGNANQGTINGGVTLGVAGLHTDAADSSRTAMTFNGSTGYVSLPTAFIPTGAHAWTLELWCNPAALPATGNYATLLNMGAAVAGELAALFLHNVSGTTHFVTNNFGGTDVTSSTVVAINTTYYVVATYDGTNVRIYVNGSLVAGPTAVTMNLVATYANIANENNQNFFNGTVQDAAIYNVALSAAQVTAHWNAGH